MMKSRKSLSGATLFSKKYNAIKWVINLHSANFIPTSIKRPINTIKHEFNWTDVLKKRNEGISEVIEQMCIKCKGRQTTELVFDCVNVLTMKQAIGGNPQDTRRAIKEWN